jgi:hypothetical protein
MKTTVVSIQPLQRFQWTRRRGLFQVIIDLRYELSTKISGPGMRVSLVSVGGEQIEIEGKIVFPKKPYEFTELIVFKPLQAGLKEGSVWEVSFPTFPDPSVKARSL